MARQLFAEQGRTSPGPSINVRFTDIRPSNGITFREDSTQTDEKYYLETMGTGVAWLDYDPGRLDGSLLRRIRRHRHLQTCPSSALRALPQQRRRHLYRRHRKGWGGGRRALWTCRC